MTDATRDGAPSAGDIADGLRRMVLPRQAAPGRRGADGSEIPVHLDPEYELPGRPEPPPVPNGWYAITGSRDLVEGGISPVVAVERELVVYRGEDGRANVIAAHCPHLGAHLGGGLVVGETIKCPYHGWRFESSGKCVDIPYSDGRIPPRACVRSYPVSEQDGFVFFWHHGGEKSPTYELPTAPELDDPDWSDAHVWTFELVAALQEMAENNVDYAHLRYVHRRPTVPDETSAFTVDGPFSRVVEQLPGGQEFTRDAYGPGVAVLRVPDVMTVYTTTTPIDRRHCRLLWHFHFHSSVADAAEDLIDGVTGGYGLQADVPIWRDKIFLEHPVLVKADGNIAEFRRWYSQFYEND